MGTPTSATSTCSKSAAKRPALVLFGETQFPTLLDKAASVLHSLAYHHLFADGNKRTARLARHALLADQRLSLDVERC